MGNRCRRVRFAVIGQRASIMVRPRAMAAKASSGEALEKTKHTHAGRQSHSVQPARI